MDSNASATVLTVPTADAPPTLPFPSARSRRRASLTPAAADTVPQLLSAAEVARRLSIGVRSLYRLAEQGILPQPIRFSRKLVRWRTAEVEAWLALAAPTPATGAAIPTPAPALPAAPASVLPEPTDVALDVLAVLAREERGLVACEIAKALRRPLDGALRKLLARLRALGFLTRFNGYVLTDRGRAMLAEANGNATV